MNSAPKRKVMAIVNATPDSFWAGSRAEDSEQVTRMVSRAVEQGATIVDIGGYSTRPGAVEVPVEEEKRRVLGAVESARRVAPSVTLSIDTFRSEVAEAVLMRHEGVIINDVSAGEIDGRMVEVVAHYGAPMVAMHMKGTPQTMQGLASYDDVVAEVREYLARRAEWLVAHGVGEVIVDPGFGFAKSVEQNFRLMEGLDTIAALGYELLVGISRKSFIYKTLGTDAEGALAGTTALHWECLRRGASVLRVHDVAEARQTIELYEKLHTCYDK